MDQPIDPNQLQLQIIDSTCLINQKLLKNNAIDGTNIIYLAGSSIVFHNIFQNTKRFILRRSDSQVVGMAFLRSTDNMVAIATKSIVQQQLTENPQNQQPKNSNRLTIELYTLGEKPTLLAQLNENTQFLDMEFYDKKKIILLTKQFDEYYFYFLEPTNKISKKQVNMQNPLRFISQDRKIAVLGEKGMKQLDLEVENLGAELRFPRMKIDDYALIDNQFEIILSQDQLYCYHDFEQSDNKSLNSFQQQLQSKIQPCCFVHVGRNLLIAHKNSITLSHFALDNGTFRFLNHYTYKEKIKGGIISMQVSFDEMHLAMAVEIVEKDTSKIENFMFNLSILSSEKKFINPFIRLFPLGTETTQITSLQGVIPFETYYLTGNTIINYTFNDSVQKKFKFSLHETPKQLCAHPLGYQFACIFDNQVKFYIKIESQIVEVWNEQFLCSSASYLGCGQLLIACLEENFYQLILYDTNAFAKIRTIPNVYMKHPVTKIELIQQDSKAILYCGHDLSIYTLKTGQKIAQFKEKKQKEEILALSYDPESSTLLASTGNKTLSYSKKLEQASWQFKYHKIIPIKQEVTCIQIYPLLQTIFMGTKSGKILWTQYPLNLMQKQYLTYSIQYKEIKVSQNAVNQILLTNNLKYMFVSFKSEGLIVCKVKKIIKFQGGMRYSEFEISNLNFLQTSSRSWMSAGEEKLKGLLEKRKTVFNDLEEYKKEWEMKKNAQLRVMERANKERQLQHVNSALSEVQRVKKAKQSCHQQLARLQQQTLSYTLQKQQKYEKQIILYYDKNIELKVRHENVSQRCANEYSTIQAKCKENIQEIQSELKKKFDVFMENYEGMKNNLGLFQKRFQIEKQQAQAILLQLFAQKRQQLLAEQNSQNQHSNELKALITKHKKELERYNSRKYFLEQKKNYFIQELNFCAKEKSELTQIKEELEIELKELEIFTNTKEKRLRKYFKENQILTKYQLIHNNLMANLDQEFQFIEEQKRNTGKNIVSVQKELSQVAEKNESYQTKIQQLKNEIQKTQNKTNYTAQKSRYLQHIIQEMSQSLEKLKFSLNDQNKAELFTEIYREFYIKRKLEKILQSSNSLDTTEQQQQMEYKIFNMAENKKKTLQNLENHKKYLEKNMNLFEKHNKKTDQEMNLNFLKYQTQNYNLIAECNIRKEQTSKKKRILHELIDSAKETQFVMNQLQKQTFDDDPKLSRPASYNSHNRKSSGSIPFYEYKKNKQENDKSRIKVLRKQESQPTLWKFRQSTYQVRKMLDIQQVTRPGTGNKMQRRIKTAMIKNRNTADGTVHIESDYLIPVTASLTSNSKKPMTATGKRHQAPFGQYNTYIPAKNKSASKPTTCTLHTNNNKASLYQ